MTQAIQRAMRDAAQGFARIGEAVDPLGEVVAEWGFLVVAALLVGMIAAVVGWPTLIFAAAMASGATALIAVLGGFIYWMFDR